MLLCVIHFLPEVNANALIIYTQWPFFSSPPPACHGSQYGLQRILGDERSLLLLARAIDPKQTNMMTEIVKILSAFCIIGEENM